MTRPSPTPTLLSAATQRMANAPLKWDLRMTCVQRELRQPFCYCVLKPFCTNIVTYVSTYASALVCQPLPSDAQLHRGKGWYSDLLQGEEGQSTLTETSARQTCISHAGTREPNLSPNPQRERENCCVCGFVQDLQHLHQTAEQLWVMGLVAMEISALRAEREWFFS